jgi:Tol biopolymer transport system component/DNA-binding winged helix-turn-helix (wHTH) protein
MPESSAVSVVRFDVFELNVRTGELWKAGDKISLPDQPLTALTALLEHPGELVTREELRQRLWPSDTFVDFEHGLNAVVKRLRDVLGDSAEAPRFIETIPRRGYRFVAPVSAVNGSPVVLAPSESPAAGPELDVGAERPVGAKSNRARPIKLVGGVILVAAVVIALLAVRQVREAPPPIVTKITQLTTDGENKTGVLVTDGLRLYFIQHVNNQPRLAQVSVSGGDTIPLPVPFARPGLDDISPDGSELFVGSYEGPGPYPFWRVPLPGGSARPLGDLRAHDVHPAPDGKAIAYVSTSDIFLANADGSGARKLASFPHQYPGFASWAPDGRRLRFNVWDPKIPESSLWEILRDGTGLRQVLPGWKTPAAECCGRWTPDGEYYVFQSSQQGVTSLWAIREKGSFWSKASPKPFQLTTGALRFRDPAPSKDGRTIFAIGDQVRGEIMRRDSTTGEWIPLSLGPSVKSITELSYSPRGDWVAYATYPEMTLWRSRLDDTDRQQLTFPPMEVSWPSWSPDGEKLVINGRFPGQRWKLYVIPANGGSPEQLIPGSETESGPDWSPDGRQIVFSGTPFSAPGSAEPDGLFLLDLATKRVTRIAGSDGMFAARWSPDRRWLVAHRMDFSKLMLLDLTSGRWKELASGVLHFASWSRDSRYVYFERWGEDTGAMRIRLSDGREEKIGSLKEFRRTIGPERCWSGLTPDNELLVLRDIGSQEIYALTLEPNRVQQ